MWLSNKLLWQGYVKKRLKSSLRKFYGIGILTNNIRSPSPECYTKFWRITIYSDTLHWTDISPIFDTLLILTLLPNCVRFPWYICNGCGMPTEDAYSTGHLVLSHFGTCMCSNVETNFSWTCLVFGLWVSNIPRYFSFAFKTHNTLAALQRYLTFPCILLDLHDPYYKVYKLELTVFSWTRPILMDAYNLTRTVLYNATLHTSEY